MSNIIIRKDGIDPYQDVLVRGQILLSAIQSINYNEFKSIVEEWLAENKIDAIKPDKWYSRQQWIKLLASLENHANTMQNQISISIKIIDNASIPEEIVIDTVEAAINILIVVYVNEQKNLPKGDTGYKVTRVDENNYEILDTSPYPFNTVYGYIWGILRRFMKRDFTLTHEFLNKENPLMGGILFKVKLTG